MEKRAFDNLGISTSLLGFGCMRLPEKDGKIDEEYAEKIIDKAYAQGVTYFDTAYPYHNGASEPFVGRVLDKYPRDSYYLATKLPCWFVKSVDDAKRIFNEQLERLHKDYVDFFLLHALNGERFREMRDLGVVDYLLTEKAAGRLKYLGFSFHDGYEAFEEIIKYRKWDFCQIQFNYMDTEDQAGIKGVRLAESLGIPLVIMEPVKGGSLATLPKDVTAEFKRIRPDASPASWALRYVGSFDNVKVILSGMSNEAQVDDNLATFNNFEKLNDEEQKAVEKTAATIRSRVFNGCTGCRYCMPCPNGVDIPHNFRIWNTYGMYNNTGNAKWEWNSTIKDEEKAKNCISCGLCETQCPQHLNIRENLASLQELMDSLR